MHHSLKILIITSLLTGCASTVESEYIETNTAKVEAYTYKYQKELEDLAGFLVEECTMKKMSANKNMKLSDLGKYFLDGRVIYQLDPSGKITNAIYEKKGRSQKACVSKFAVGYQLPKPEGLQYVYGKFTLEVNG
jgi:hypothetical protein